jgi:hypothetical protein
MRHTTCTLTLLSGLLLFSAVQAAGPIGTSDPLTFFDEAVPETLYRFEADVTIDEHSLETGLVATNTCHFNLDPIDRVEILFARERLHDLDIVSHDGIGTVVRDGHLVSLRDVTRGASICISVRTRSLERIEDGYVLKGGPLQRRFLDSLHPMAMRGTVHLGTDKLVYRTMEPANQPGWQVELKPGRIDYGGYFAGILRTEIRFDQIRALATAPMIMADNAMDRR